MSGLLTALWTLGVAPAVVKAAEVSTVAVAEDSTDPDSSPARRRRNEKSIMVTDDDASSADEPDVAADEASETDFADAAADGVDADEEFPDLPEPIASVSDYDAEYDAQLSDFPLDDAEPAEGAPSSSRVAEAEPQPAPAESKPIIQAASFNGLVPGETTRDEVLSQWGKPAARTSRGDAFTYELPNFPSVTVNFEGDVVDSLRVVLFEPASAQRLIAKLGLSGIEPVKLHGPGGDGVATIFPERGVSLNHRPAVAAALATDAGSASATPAGDDAVYEIELSRIEAEPFLTRAQSASAASRSQQLADLENALRLDPASAKARALLAGLKLAAGQAVNAEKLAAEAVQLEPKNDQYRLLWAKCLKYLAQYDAAVREARTVLEGPHATPLVRAQALEQMALLASLGSKDVQERAIPLHNKAIALADDLTKSDDPAIRVPATQLLVDAHLAVAEQIAAGTWKNKDRAVGDWIARASGLAEGMIAAGEADASLRLQVAVSALSAGAHLDPPIDPALWVAEAEQTVERLYDETGDPGARAELDWQLGLAYFYATQIQHRRGQAESALKYGTLAEAALAPLADARAEFPDTEYVMGRLYFQIGAVHAVHGQDHAMACQWYDRAAESLMRPVPVTALAGPKGHGDALVSMGVSYWEVGQRDRAYELTKAGVELVEQGVAEGLLAADALDVPMHNLDAMNRALGKVEAAGAAVPADEQTQIAEQRPESSPKRVTRQRPRSQPRMARRTNETGNTRRR